MFDDYEIRINFAEARRILLSFEKHGAKMPRAADLRNLTGPASSSAALAYRAAMREGVMRIYAQFNAYLALIRRDCAIGVAVLDDFAAQEAEIVALLQKYASDDLAYLAPRAPALQGFTEASEWEIANG